MNQHDRPEETSELGSESEPEAYSLFGEPLYRIEFPNETEERYRRNLEEARRRYREEPANHDAIVWYGRRLGYLTRYRDAIEVYGEGLAKFPESYILLRHRGHRLISVRAFDRAVADLQSASRLSADSADEVEPDGEPNQAGVPTSTVRFNILYHLALAHYLLGDFEQALSVYRECMAYSTQNPDTLVATTDWMYMTLRRLGRHREAEAILESISADMPIVENFAYHHRLLVYKGLKAAEELLGAESTAHHDTATHGYGIGNWYLVTGRIEEAREVFRRVLDTQFWPAFGYIAAEADMKRGIDSVAPVTRR
jgi:tetratricopeptide (TPR) repeat protein